MCCRPDPACGDGTLRHGHTSREPGDRGTSGTYAVCTCHHSATTAAWPEMMASVLVVGLCSWFSFAFSFKIELSPWELLRRAPAGGGAQRTFLILQVWVRGPPFPGHLFTVDHMSLFSLNASCAHNLHLRHSHGIQASNCFLCLLLSYMLSTVHIHACFPKP